MITYTLTCKCGNSSLVFKWEIKDRDDWWAKTIMHDGWGFQFEDSIIECTNCGQKAPYGKFETKMESRGKFDSDKFDMGKEVKK